MKETKAELRENSRLIYLADLIFIAPSLCACAVYFYLKGHGAIFISLIIPGLGLIYVLLCRFIFKNSLGRFYLSNNREILPAQTSPPKLQLAHQSISQKKSQTIKQLISPILKLNLSQISKTLAVSAAILIGFMGIKKIVIASQASKIQCGNFEEDLIAWDSSLEPHPSRLSAALAFYEAGILPAACLKQEAEQNESDQNQKDLTQLALILIAPQQDTILKQIESICLANKNSEACALADELQFESPKRNQASIAANANHSEFIKIVHVKKLAAKQYFHQLNDLLSDSHQMKSFSDFYVPLRIQSYWELEKKPEAHATYDSVAQYARGIQALKYSDQMCTLEIGSGCETQKPKSCSGFIHSYELTPMPERSAYERNYILANKCLDGNKIDFSKLEKQLNNERAKSYVTILKDLQEKKIDEAKMKIESFIKANSEDSFADLARRLLVETAQTQTELKALEDYFLAHKILNAQGAYVGADLMKRLANEKEFLRANQIALKVIQYYPYRFEYYSAALYWSQRAGDFKTAREISALRKEYE